MYSLVMDAGAPENHPTKEFPIKPPSVKFLHKVNIPFVNGSGIVNVDKVRLNWQNLFDQWTGYFECIGLYIHQYLWSACCGYLVYCLVDWIRKSFLHKAFTDAHANVNLLILIRHFANLHWHTTGWTYTKCMVVRAVNYLHAVLAT